MSRRIAATFFLCAFVAEAQEKKPEPPRAIAISPLRATLGETQTLRLRGLKLKDVTEVRCTPTMTVTVKEKKDAAPPNGLEAKDVGDQELAIEVNIPADFSGKKIALEVVTPTGTTSPQEVAVVAKDFAVREKEPNNGFRESQPWDAAKPMAGKIDGDKDVDVFRISGTAGKSMAFRITAASAGSLLDPILAIFDGDGRMLVTADDSDGGRDAKLSLTPKTDGPLFLVVSDAHDRGGAWHEYSLEREP